MFGLSGFSRDSNFMIAEERVPFLVNISEIGGYKIKRGSSPYVETPAGVKYYSDHPDYFVQLNLAYFAWSNNLRADDTSGILTFLRPLEFGASHCSYNGTNSTSSGGGWIVGDLYPLDTIGGKQCLNYTLHLFRNGSTAVPHDVANNLAQTAKAKTYSFAWGSDYDGAGGNSGHGLNVYNDAGVLINSTERGKMLDIKQVVRVPIAYNNLGSWSAPIDPSISLPAISSHGFKMYGGGASEFHMQPYIDPTNHCVRFGGLCQNNESMNGFSGHIDAYKKLVGDTHVTCFIIDAADYE